MSKRIHVLINGEQHGPYPETEFCQHVADRKIVGSDLVWREGMPAWVTVDAFLAEPDVEDSEGVSMPAAELSIEELGVAAAEGDVNACGRLGLMLLETAGKETAGLRLLEMAADANDVEAQFVLGMRYANGRGVPQNDGEAVAWFRKAAKQEHVVAQCSLAYMIEEGRGAIRNYAEAARLYRLAAERGDAVAQNNLGMLLAAGRGGPKNNTEAAKWFAKAAQQNVPGAQMNLGLMLARGHGLPQDAIEAYKWLNLAAVQGHTTAAKNRDILAVGMTHDQITEAQQRSASWGLRTNRGL